MSETDTEVTRPPRFRVPPEFYHIPYNGKMHPGAPAVRGLTMGANCQQFAFELLRFNGLQISNFRSSELWADRLETMVANAPFEPGDLLLFNSSPTSWGAHVAVAIDSDSAVHLAWHIGNPVNWLITDFKKEDRYRCFIGAKRLVRN